jgi:UDP-sugar transporter A1/2/3
LKDGSETSLWIRNMQMYVCGAAAALVGCWASDGPGIAEHGFTHGYTSAVWSIIGLLSMGGIYM